MRCDSEFDAFAKGSGMGADEGDETGFVRQASRVFAAELFKPMVQRATVAPDEVLALIAELRAKLDIIDEVIASCPDAGRPPALRQRQGAMAAGGRRNDGGRGDEEARDGLDDVGRNQRSRLRELAMLEVLAREARPYALQQVTSALESRGFGDQGGAVVSQLHRLKKLGIIDQPANGMYVITDQGLAHLRRLRTSFGGLMGPV
jgi:hypothetical protein